MESCLKLGLDKKYNMLEWGKSARWLYWDSLCSSPFPNVEQDSSEARDIVRAAIFLFHSIALIDTVIKSLETKGFISAFTSLHL